MPADDVAGRRAAVLGSPIAHSLSPALHRAAYAELGLHWRYDAIECDEARLTALLGELDDSFVGLSLTMPLKRAVLPLLDEADPLVHEVGAANTVIFDGVGPFRRRRGYNTDVAGLVAAVRAQVGPARIGSATILGAGGTAAAAVAACRELGLPRATAVVRDRGRAADLLAAAARLGVEVGLDDWPGLDAVPAADLVISTVPAGAADALADVAVPLFRPGQLLFDVLYEPWPTRLALAAQQAGAQVVGGLELLVQQAAVQVELMTGRRAPLAAMQACGRSVLASR